MNWKKHTISFVLAGCMTASALPAAFAVEAQAETPVPVSEAVTAQPQTSMQNAKSGKCGANLTWTLDDEGTLTISGTGKMDSYRWLSDASLGMTTWMKSSRW